jgi:hypothetical protein
VIIYLSILILLLSIKSIVRPHVIHLIHVIVPAFLLGGIVAIKKGRGIGVVPSIITLFFMILMLITPIHYLYAKITDFIDNLECNKSCINEAYHKILSDNHNFSRAKYFILDDSQKAAIEYLQANTSTSDKLFVGNASHQRVFVNDVLFYFISERDSVTMFHELHPGQITTDAVQQQVLNDIRDSNAPYVVIVNKWDNISEPNKSNEASSVDVLDNYLYNEYKEVAKIGHYIVRHKENTQLLQSDSKL